MAPDANLQATEQSLGVELVLPMTRLQFWWLHPSLVLFGSFPRWVEAGAFLRCN